MGQNGSSACLSVHRRASGIPTFPSSMACRVSTAEGWCVVGRVKGPEAILHEGGFVQQHDTGCGRQEGRPEREDVT